MSILPTPSRNLEISWTKSVGRAWTKTVSALDSGWLPLACGVFASALAWGVWGSLAQPAVANDESAYLLQAKIFASGHLVAPGRPLPEFFQQFHVFVEPVLAAKYPPGHALLLTPGIWFGVPGLVPVVLVGLTAVLLCSLTRHFTNGPTALLAVFLANTSDIALRFNPSYFSEITTAALFLTAWWTLLQYWRFGHSRWLVFCALAVAWGAITRPLTMLAFALPAGGCAAIAMKRHGRWRDAGTALAGAIVVLALQATWNARVVGDWWKMPHSEYAKLYTPSDRLGFHASPAPPPAARLSVEEQAADQTMRRLQDGYSLARLPSTASERAANIVHGTWAYGGIPLIAILFAASLLPIAISRVVIGTVVCVFVAYLAWPHDPTWTLYYLELQAPLAFLTAAGIYRVAHVCSSAGARRWAHLATLRVEIRQLAFVAAAVWLVAPAFHRVESYRRAHAAQRAYRQSFERSLATLPRGPAIVFVRYAADHVGEDRVVDNVPDLSAAQIWIVHDRGPENPRLMALAPDRTGYLCRERRQGDSFGFTIERLPEPQSSGQSGLSASRVSTPRT